MSKLSDSDTENGETQTWLDFALACEYITTEDHKKLNDCAEEVAKLLVFMMNKPEKFLVKAWQLQTYSTFSPKNCKP